MLMTSTLALALAVQAGSRPPPIPKQGIPVPGAPSNPDAKPVKIGKDPTGGSGGGRPPTLLKTEETRKKEAADKAAAEQAAAVAAILGQPLSVSKYSWSRGELRKTLPRVATHVCVLTKVSGKFAGGGERVSLYIDGGATGGPRWMLDGDSGQDALTATATCAPKAQFATAGELSARAYADATAGSCPPKKVSAQDSSARAYFLGGMGGKFAGGGEQLSAVRSGGEGALRISACSGYVIGNLLSYGVDGVPSKYRTPYGRIPESWKATFGIGVTIPEESFFDFISGKPFHVGDSAVPMVPVDEAICGLTLVKGKFQGYGEEATIDQRAGPDGRQWWVLSVASKADGSMLSAGARCLARDQR